MKRTYEITKPSVQKVIDNIISDLEDRNILNSLDINTLRDIKETWEVIIHNTICNSDE